MAYRVAADYCESGTENVPGDDPSEFVQLILISPPNLPCCADMSSSVSDHRNDSSLYDPPINEGERADLEAAADEEVLHLNIPENFARELAEVATHLGLSPSIVASRAIDLVCDEIDTVDESALSTGTLIQQYQARLDLLHNLEDESGPSEEGEPEPENEDDPWAKVDEIIEKAEGNA